MQQASGWGGTNSCALAPMCSSACMSCWMGAPASTETANVFQCVLVSMAAVMLHALQLLWKCEHE
jgi:hypothetical protein